MSIRLDLARMQIPDTNCRKRFIIGYNHQKFIFVKILFWKARHAHRVISSKSFKTIKYWTSGIPGILNPRNKIWKLREIWLVSFGQNSTQWIFKKCRFIFVCAILFFLNWKHYHVSLIFRGYEKKSMFIYKSKISL